MVQLIKKGGLRERANRSKAYQGSENTRTTLAPNRYQPASSSTNTATTDVNAAQPNALKSDNASNQSHAANSIKSAPESKSIYALQR